MPKDALGRNDPCPCGSGKKYKKCCLTRDEANAPKGVESHVPVEHAGCSPHDHQKAGVLHVPEGLTEAEVREYVQRLDRWSHAAHDALDEGRLEEAERLAEQLRTGYPDQIDGYKVRAQVRMHQERWIEAAEGFERAVAVALEHREDYDEKFIEDLRKDAEHARAHAEGRVEELDSPPGNSRSRPRQR